MPRKQPQLAKLTRPKLHKAVERTRLFALLDEARGRNPTICVVGPPGAGKTTLVASWLDSQAIKGIWYQVDTGDADLATFFYYLGEAARPFLRKGQRPMPALTHEYLEDVRGFGRRFFRELFSRLPEGAALVLDNYQEVEARERLHEIVAEAAAEVVPPQSLVVVSRRDPPDCYARLRANDNACIVDWPDLQFTVAEVRSVIEIRGLPVSLSEASHWHQVSDGWAAGLTLMLDDKRRGGRGHAGTPTDRDAVFGYFAGNLFDKASPEMRRFLMATALLPQVRVSTAAALTGMQDAAEILNDLYRRHLFTHRRLAQEHIYWYHALFREFLKAQASRYLTDEARKALVRQAAQLLQECGDHDDALHLFAEGADWTSVTHLILARAPDLLAKGRGQTLREWIFYLPDSYLASDPKLRYWLGSSLIPIDQPRARVELEAAFDAALARQDITEQLEATTRIVSTYYFEWSQFISLDRWIDVLENLMSACPVYPSSELELDANCSMLLATLYRRPGHPLLGRCVKRVLAMLDASIDLNRRVAGAICLLSYAVLARDNVVGQRAMEFVRPLLEHEELSPLNQVWVNARLGYFLYQIAQYEDAWNQILKAENLIEAYGLKGLRSAGRLIDSYGCCVLVGLRDFERTRQRIHRMAPRADFSRPMDRFHVQDPYCYLESATGDLHQLEQHAKSAIEAADLAGMPYVRAMSRIFLSGALAEQHKFDELEKVIADVRTIIDGTCHAHYEVEIDVIEAFSMFLRAQPDAAVETLERALYGAKVRNGQFHLLRHNHRILGRIGIEALERGIEVRYANEMLKRFRVSPADTAIETWPWMAKVYTLGRFEIHAHGELLRFAGKAPQRLLKLLKVIVAFGGRQVPEERLIDALWPDEDPGAARKALDIAILRLRKLLGGNESILVGEGLVDLNSQYCWVDTWAFERRAAEFDGTSAVQAIELYRGSFLQNDVDAAWSVKMRERLRGVFVRLVESAAKAEEAAGRWERAVDLYTKGLEADDLTEAFYQGLMRCYRALGRHTDAMKAFRRLRQLLSVVLGISPSQASQDLARALQRDNPAQHEAP